MINLFDSNPINGHSFMNDLKKEFEKTMKQTAVDWYEKEIDSLFQRYETKEISNLDFIVMKHNVFYQAKEMEKEQIEDAFIQGEHQQGFEGEAEQYYKETYGEK